VSRPAPDGVVATVLTAKSLRTYCYGFLGVLFPLHLASGGVLKIVYDLLLYVTCRRATLRESR